MLLLSRKLCQLVIFLLEINFQNFLFAKHVILGNNTDNLSTAVIQKHWLHLKLFTVTSRVLHPHFQTKALDTIYIKNIHEQPVRVV